jgi:polyisoprenoid-binding protein YceI
MKKITYPLAAAIILFASAFTVSQSQKWKIAENYAIKFDGGDPSGEFSGLKGSISFDEKDLASSKFDVGLDVATINTGNGMKNTHAKSKKWLDATTYPTIKFTSTSIERIGSGYKAKGTLDMHGVQKEISFPFTFDGNIFAGGFEVNRLDYNINTAEPTHGSAKFKVSVSVPVTKQ